MTDIGSTGKAAPRRPLLVTLAFVFFFCSLLAVVAAALAGFGSRIGLWNFRTGFSILRYSCIGGGLAGIASLFVLIAASGRRPLLAIAVSLASIVLGLGLAGRGFAWKERARRMPPIHDISTDVVNPPSLSALLPLRTGAANPPEYGGAAVAAQQRKAYPDIKTAVLDLPPDRAFAACLQTAHSLGWRVVSQRPDEGMIEATDTTFWFGFTDDIVVRVSPAGTGRSLVDVRSLSRVGIGDMGTNAARIRSFLNLLPKG